MFLVKCLAFFATVCTYYPKGKTIKDLIIFAVCNSSVILKILLWPLPHPRV